MSFLGVIVRGTDGSYQVFLLIDEGAEVARQHMAPGPFLTEESAHDWLLTEAAHQGSDGSDLDVVVEEHGSKGPHG